MTELYPGEREGYKWRVVWFPPDKPFAIFHGLEEQVRRRAEQESDWHPLVERRAFTLGHWEGCDG